MWQLIYITQSTHLLARLRWVKSVRLLLNDMQKPSYMLQLSTSHAKIQDISARVSFDTSVQLSCYMSAPLSCSL